MAIAPPRIRTPRPRALRWPVARRGRPAVRSAPPAWEAPAVAPVPVPAVVARARVPAVVFRARVAVQARVQRRAPGPTDRRLRAARRRRAARSRRSVLGAGEGAERCVAAAGGDAQAGRSRGLLRSGGLLSARRGRRMQMSVQPATAALAGGRAGSRRRALDVRGIAVGEARRAAIAAPRVLPARSRVQCSRSHGIRTPTNRHCRPAGWAALVATGGGVHQPAGVL